VKRQYCSHPSQAGWTVEMIRQRQVLNSTVVLALVAQAFDLARVDFVVDQYPGSVVSAAAPVLANPQNIA